MAGQVGLLGLMVIGKGLVVVGDGVPELLAKVLMGLYGFHILHLLHGSSNI
jgi:hypothetical protein